MSTTLPKTDKYQFELSGWNEQAATDLKAICGTDELYTCYCKVQAGQALLWNVYRAGSRIGSNMTPARVGTFITQFVHSDAGTKQMLVLYVAGNYVRTCKAVHNFGIEIAKANGCAEIVTYADKPQVIKYLTKKHGFTAGKIELVRAV